ncbi:hypothetical protein [Paenibacillus sp. FSL E2-0177]|uniref:hypothetical protein n=1 Tax=Paenibacillus sp. FSL E2-0177 TaxID=2921360 RepID=UPI0030ECBBB9
MNSTWGQLLFYGMELKRKVMDFTVPYDHIPRVAFSDIGLGGWMVGGGRWTIY